HSLGSGAVSRGQVMESLGLSPPRWLAGFRPAAGSACAVSDRQLAGAPYLGPFSQLPLGIRDVLAGATRREQQSASVCYRLGSPAEAGFQPGLPPEGTGPGQYRL